MPPTKAEYQAELRGLGLPVSGTLPELRKRLADAGYELYEADDEIDRRADEPVQVHEDGDRATAGRSNDPNDPTITTERREGDVVGVVELQAEREREGTDERSCPKCGKVHGSSLLPEAELAELGDVRGRSEDGSPSGLYRVFVHRDDDAPPVFYVRVHEPEEAA